MTQEQFNEFSNPTNNVGKLLQSHFVAVQLLLQPVTVNELAGREPSTPSGGTVRWLGNIHSSIEEGMRGFYEWPISMAEAVRKQMCQNRIR